MEQGNSSQPVGFNTWLGRTIRVTLIDNRVFQGVFVAIDFARNLLLRYAEVIERKDFF